MKAFRGSIFLFYSWATLLVACENKEKDYPEIITEHGLEALYDQALIDWHILNSTGKLSESAYLLRWDTLVDKKIYVPDTSSSYNSVKLNPAWIHSADSMRKHFPEHVFDFLEVKLTLFYPEQYGKLEGDTIIFPFSPEMIENDHLIDPIDGFYSGLHYVVGKLIKEKNDHFLIDLPDSFVRPYQADLIQLVESKPKKAVHPQLRRRIRAID